MNTEIRIKYELRPCVVTHCEAWKKGLFHRWVELSSGKDARELTHKTLDEWKMYALVELEDGSVEYVPAYHIIFLDKKHDDYAWEDEE